jgi:two-component system, OmpR family, phosphate regulon response regulator PhoB
MAAVPDWNSMRKRILIVDDEPAIRDMVAFALRKDDYDVVHAGDAREAQLAIADRVPDLVLLDWMLPGTSGLELARRWRQADLTGDVPIIMLTARGEESERVRGLATGADDYIVKPFSVPELVARVRALLRRANPERVANVLTFGDIELDREKKRVSRSGQPVDLGPTEYRLLEFLMERPGRVFSRAQLLDGVWGSEIYIDERTVDVHVGRLRKALNRGHAADPIRTVRGAGYALNDLFGKTAVASSS